MISNECLQHVGVRGMKWGTRKKRSSEVVSSSKKADYSAAKAILLRNTSNTRSVYKNRSHMSDTELRNYLNRVGMERQLRDLNPTMLDKGKKMVNQALMSGAQQVLTKYITKGLDAGLSKSVTKLSKKDPIVEQALKAAKKTKKPKIGTSIMVSK